MNSFESLTSQAYSAMHRNTDWSAADASMLDLIIYYFVEFEDDALGEEEIREYTGFLDERIGGRD